MSVSKAKAPNPGCRFIGTGDIVYPMSRMELSQAADDGSQGAQMLLNLKTPQVSDGTSGDAAVRLDVYTIALALDAKHAGQISSS